MRHLLLAFVVVAGCSAQGLPIEGGSSPGGGSGGTGGSGGIGVSIGADMAPQLGGMGAMCQTACDCMPGLACQNGTCGTSQFGAIYCCEANDCPTGNFCQSSMGGFGQCMGNSGGFGGSGGGNDLGFITIDAGVSFCAQVMCGQNSDCTDVGCTMCSRRGTCR